MIFHCSCIVHLSYVVVTQAAIYPLARRVLLSNVYFDSCVASTAAALDVERYILCTRVYCKRVIGFCAVEVRSRSFPARDGGWKGGVISAQTSIKEELNWVYIRLVC